MWLLYVTKLFFVVFVKFSVSVLLDGSDLSLSHKLLQLRSHQASQFLSIAFDGYAAFHAQLFNTV